MNAKNQSHLSIRHLPWYPDLDPWRDHMCLTVPNTSYIALKQTILLNGMYCNKTCKTSMTPLHIHFLKFKDNKKYTQRATEMDSASAMMNNKETIMQVCISIYITGMCVCAYMCVHVHVRVYVCTCGLCMNCLTTVLKWYATTHCCVDKKTTTQVWVQFYLDFEEILQRSGWSLWSLCWTCQAWANKIHNHCFPSKSLQVA